MNNCQRCNVETKTLTGSRFNTQMICKTCEQKEKQHKDYQKAYDAELNEVKKATITLKGSVYLTI